MCCSFELWVAKPFIAAQNYDSSTIKSKNWDIWQKYVINGKILYSKTCFDYAMARKRTFEKRPKSTICNDT